MSEPLVNYYELLQISPTAEPLTIQRAYRLLAATYHPDNPETADPEKFLACRKLIPFCPTRSVEPRTMHAPLRTRFGRFRF